MTSSLLLLLGLGSAASASAAFQQTRFVIGGGPDPLPTNESYGAMREAGITFLHADSNEIVGIPRAQEMASLCALHNLSCLLPLSSFKAIAPSTNVWGYFIRDEPRAADFPRLAAEVAAVRKVRPDALGFINLLGGGGRPAKALYGTDTYEEYVDMFLSMVKPDIMSFDVYPSNTTTWLYHDTLALYRNKSLQHNIPFWNYVLLSANGRGVGAGWYRWSLSVAATYGSKGFMQWALSPCADVRVCGPHDRWVPYPTFFDKYGHPFKPTFDMAKAEHRPWAVLGPVLLQMTSRNVARTGPKASRPVPLANMPLQGMSGPFVVGHFQRHSRIEASNVAYDDCVMVTNDDPIDTRFGSLDFGRAGTSAVREVNVTDGQLVPIVDAAPDVPGFQLFFSEGEGRLLCWMKQEVLV